jgi:hypothetical protein
MAVCTRCGKVSKSIREVLGRRVSRPLVAGEVLACSAGSRSSRPKPSSRRTWPDAGAVQADPFDGEPGADLVHRQALVAQADDPGAGAVFLRGALAAGQARRGEQDQFAGAQVTGQRFQRGGGVAEPGGGLVQGDALVEVGA